MFHRWWWWRGILQYTKRTLRAPSCAKKKTRRTRTGRAPPDGNNNRKNQPGREEAGKKNTPWNEPRHFQQFLIALLLLKSHRAILNSFCVKRPNESKYIHNWVVVVVEGVENNWRHSWNATTAGRAYNDSLFLLFLQFFFFFFFTGINRLGSDWGRL